MFLIDPVGVMFSSLLVGLMAMAFLLLAHTATVAHLRTAVVLWMLGDAAATLSRLTLLGQPGVLHTSGMAWLTPWVVDILNGTLVISGALLHTLSIRSALAERPSQLAMVLPGLALPLGYAAIAAALPAHGLRLQLMLAIALGLVVWTGLIAWPRRHSLRGARMIIAVMAFFGVLMGISIVGLGLHPPPPVPARILPPMPPLLIDLTSALAMTLAFTLVLFELLQRRIELLSTTDPLTGVLNRRGGLRQLDDHWNWALRRRTSVVLAILDLDHFKRINDQLGHAMGDEVLVGFAQRLRTVTRSTDVVARWGGEEFLLLMPETDVHKGLQVVERVRQAMAASPLTPGAPIVTVSVGVAALVQGDAPTDHEGLLARADARLYRAKERRNCVVAAEDEAVPA